ncbi:MAG: aldehyde dehydrogenase family protein [Halieaceae bacterium]|jgi:acyl-CoA reductase-like NAD-dependent aldehyde dehydrogenase|nr:aldehyde dehydrogenase family protein [Halieaceae bacterium]MDG1493337.1 aldehyde dehydrogenase family protein [Luminiphilus sp.]MBT5207912.1 aldehyde dehydrogenase family protein [Halieaceae bacterium]MBT6263439.1 aldehyde dehydrogenase family protein [Halieaceae bacterium]MBT6334098.1 aldehyde dehydrogenase family protein [Halieaceae bacterium]
MSDYSMLINGKSVGAEGSIEVVNPATEAAIATVPEASLAQLDDAVAAARRALPGWSAHSMDERRALILKIADRLEENIGELAQLLSEEQGKPIEGFAGLGAMFELGGSLAWIRYTASLDLPVEVIQDNDEARIEVHRKPVGVVGSITPWNYPLLITCWHIIPGLLAGCTVVAKPSEYTPLTVLKAMHLISDLLPPGVVNIVTGKGELGAAISSHSDIDKIVFTGSTRTGKRIMEAAADNLKRLTLELGGNDAAIVLPDTNVAEAAGKIFATAMINNGQTCAALKRLYVHEDIYEEMCEALAGIAGSVKTGPASESPDFGPIQNKMQYDRVCELAESAKADGATFLTGGEPMPGPGYFFPVTIVKDIPESSRLVQEEPFGPILPVVSFSDVEDALEKANAVSVGLGGSVWSSDVAVAQKLASRLECGTAWVNNHAMIQPDAPFGGVKQSGVGVEFGRYGLVEYTNIQTLQISKS